MNIRHLNIEVTKRCNQRCFYCFNDSGKGSLANEYTPAQWLEVLESLQRKGLESIHLTGGEPFTYKYATELLAGAQAINLSTSILSNGFRVEGLAKQFPQVFSRLSVAQISLDSMDEQTHNARRGYTKAWQDAIKAIAALRNLSVPLEVSCVVSQGNLVDIKAVADFCRNIDAALIIRPLLPSGRASTHIQPETFTQELEVCVEALQNQQDVRLAEDRFQYVVDGQEMQQKQTLSGMCTVSFDGKLRNDRSNINLFHLAA